MVGNLSIVLTRLTSEGCSYVEDGGVDEKDRDAEFSEYVAIRWARLVRSAVLLGCSLPEAEDVVQAALTRCLLNWSKVRSADDRDAYVHRVLINSFTSGRRRRWVTERPVAVVPEGHQDDDTARYDDGDVMQRSLGRLNPDCAAPRFSVQFL